MHKALMLLFAVFTVTVGAADSTNRLHFPVNGFFIKPLEQKSDKLPAQPLIMTLPVQDNFSANVNVQIQSYAGTLDEFVALSEKQFKDAQFEVIKKQKLDSSAVSFEYTGRMQGEKVHWYSRAVRSLGKVYLVTATGLEKHWPTEGAGLKACVDSFQREGDEKRAASPR